MIMSSGPDAPPSPLAAWLAATEGAATPPPDGRPTTEERPQGRRRRLLAMATVPWLAVAVMVLLTVDRPTAGGRDALPAPTAPVSQEPGAPVVAGAPRADLDGMAAAAVLAVRLAAAPDRYVDTAVAERAVPAGGLHVVTVRAAVLDRLPGGWGPAQTVRYAVAIGRDADAPIALGVPWQVPGPAVAPPPSTTAPIDDPALAETAVKALSAAGYRKPRRPVLRRIPAFPDVLVVAIRAQAPGDRVPRDHEVWLDATGSAVLGTEPSGVRARPVPVPVEHP